MAGKSGPESDSARTEYSRLTRERKVAVEEADSGEGRGWDGVGKRG